MTSFFLPPLPLAHSLLLLFSSCSSIGEHWFFAFLCHNRLRGCRPVSTLARWRPVCVWAAVNVRGQAAREENTRVQKELITTLAFCILVLFFLPPALREMYWKVAGTRARDVTAGRCLSSLLTWEEERKREHTAWVERVGACADAVCGYALGGGWCVSEGQIHGAGSDRD